VLLNLVDADKLDVRSVLRSYADYEGTNPLEDGYLVVTSDGNRGSYVFIDPDGHGPGGRPILATLERVDPSFVTLNDFWF
jgi:hypothetical protein